MAVLMLELPDELIEQRYCTLTTTQRVTARRHTAELWFVPARGGVYLLSGSGGLTTWCLNLQASEQGVLRVGTRSWLARAAVMRSEDPARDGALRAFHDKYDAEPEDRTAAWTREGEVVHLVLVREL